MKILDSILNSLPIPKKNEPVEYYFGLNISSNMVYGCVWGIRSGKLHVISSSKTVYESEKDLIEASNYVLDEALADFKPEPTKILFGVPDDWLADDDLILAPPDLSLKLPHKQPLLQQCLNPSPLF